MEDNNNSLKLPEIESIYLDTVANDKMEFPGDLYKVMFTETGAILSENNANSLLFVPFWNIKTILMKAKQKGNVKLN